MGLVDHRLQHVQGIGRHIVDVAGRREGIGAAGEQLDPVHAALSVLAYGRAPFLGRGDPNACERIDRNVGCDGRAPDDAASRHFEARSVEAAFIDGIAHLDIGEAIAVRAHVARRGEARPQVGLQVMDRDQGRGLPRHTGLRVVEHVRMRVDQAREHGGLAEIDHLRIVGDFHLRGGPDLAEALALQNQHLIGQHLAACAVEQATGADRHHAGGRRALIGAAFRPEARLRSGSPPGRACSAFLRPHRRRKRGRDANANCGRFQRGFASHRNFLPYLKFL